MGLFALSQSQTACEVSIAASQVKDIQMNCPSLPKISGSDSPKSSMRTKPRPAPYPAHLVPHPSVQCPHCLARERLFLWKPASAQQAVDATGHAINLTDGDLEKILSVMSRAWAEETLEMYASGLLADMPTMLLAVRATVGSGVEASRKYNI